MQYRSYRSAFVFSTELNAELIAVHVISDLDKRFTEEERVWLKNAAEIAELLQIKIVYVKGQDISREIAKFANENNITKIVIGKPLKQGNVRSIDRLLSLTQRHRRVHIRRPGQGVKQENRHFDKKSPKSHIEIYF